MGKETTCSGTLNGTRWCDNGDGTVTDLTTGLIWLKKADWGGGYAFWTDDREKTTAHDRASSLRAGASGAELTDSSVEGDWRLPTLSELASLISGDEAVSTWEMRAFTGVQPAPYWSSASYSAYPTRAYFVHLLGGNIGSFNKKTPYFVWPVRTQAIGNLKLRSFDPEVEEAPEYILG